MRKITYKIIFLSILCCLLVALMFGAVSIYSVFNLTTERTAELESTLIQNYDDNIRNQVISAVSVLQRLYDRSRAGEITFEESKAMGADLLRKMRYGIDNSGYFWADTVDGVNVVLDPNPAVEGTTRLNDKDVNGKLFIQEIIQAGLKEGGGFTDYWFPKAGETDPSPKRGYSLAFKPFNWVIGTGNYIDDINRVVAGSQQQATATKTRTITMLIIIGLLTIIISVALSFLVGKGISKPVVKVTELIGKTAKLDLVYDITFDRMLKYRDETGTMAKSLAEMRQSIREVAGKIIGISTALAASSEELNATTEENAKTVNQVVTAINEIAEGNGNQAETVTAISSSMGGIVSNLNEVSTAMAVSTKNAENSLVVVKEGQEAINLITEKMRNNIEISNLVGSSINELSESIGKVGNFVDVINMIATQTNLLALNAAIEAARAGEAGKGFAVVSEEIRKLAEGSASAAKEITDIVRDTVQRSMVTAENMNRAKKVVEEQETAVNISNKAFEKISKAVEDISTQTDQAAAMLKKIDASAKVISDQTQDMAAVAEQSAASSQEISASSHEQLAAIQMIAEAADELSVMAMELNTEIRKFKLTNE